jgi:cell division protein FtsZ
MVFIAAGMGGGTGTGASPIIADIAREAGALTVAVVTKPFAFEGKRRMVQADEGIKHLLGKVDSLLVIPNDRLKAVSEQKLTFANAFEIADGVLHQAVVSISELIKNTGFINLDFADVTAIMKDAGYAHMGVGHAGGKGKAEEAARAAVTSPLMETSIDGARGVLINVTGSYDIGLEDVEAAASLVQEAAHPEANIIFGASFDENMEDEIRVVVIATRFESEQVSPAKEFKGAFTTGLSGLPKRDNISEPVQIELATPVTSQVSTPKAEVLPAEPQQQNIPQEQPVMQPQPQPQPPEEEEEDPFDTIFKIFNTK